MRALSTEFRRGLERSVLEGRWAAELGVRAALGSLGVEARDKPGHLSEEQARLRRGLRAKQRQLGGGFELLVWECAYEQWHRLLFARFLAENGLLRHPVYEAPVTLAECEELAEDLGEPDGWSVAARFASEILPGIFRLDDPTVQVRLAAEHRVALEQIVGGLPGEVFLADDSLGWVYQHWQSERKDQVNASEVKIGGADLAPVTQLFTENYMVRFLLENSLGAWWAARHPDSPLVKEFEFLRFDEDGQPAAGMFDGWPDAVAEVTVMDPCCGSGHFLVEAFWMLWRMRAEEEGLEPIAAQDAVLRDNLFGLELDPRCVQIAMFAVALSAWKQGDGWRQLPTPNIACSGIPAKAPLKEWTALAEGDQRLERALERLHSLFKDADTLGSLIDPRRAADLEEASGQIGIGAVGFDEIAPLLDTATASEADDPATAVLGADAAGIARAAFLLSRTYTLVATNPPYLGANKQVEALITYGSRTSGTGTLDLAYLMRVRVGNMSCSGVHALVMPSEWLASPRIADLRTKWLRSSSFLLFARLGFGAFSGGLRVNPLLQISRDGHLEPLHRFQFVDLPDTLRSVGETMSALGAANAVLLAQESQLRNPDAAISTLVADGIPLGDMAECKWGLGAGDGQRFERFFWEVADFGTTWDPLQGSASDGKPFSGRSTIVLWEQESGAMARLAHEVRHRNHKAQQWRSGKPLWGKKGISINRVGDQRIALYTGDKFGEDCLVVVPHKVSDLPALWHFARSGELARRLRAVDRGIAITPRSVRNVPIELPAWRLKAEALDGLPEPWSDDPSQWLFEGRPEVATEPLQVGVGRLVGYRWPEQPEDDGLDGHADADGIVCLPAVRGEPSAADRLSALLAAAYGEEWSTAVASRLPDEAGSTKKTLADWLGDDFFKHHCKVFRNRPFVWHIWDGRKDGFAALVNYHRLDRSGLEKLTYTYLGDWIERQRASAADEVAGADMRLAAALELRAKLEAILEGEPPFDIYVRWKSLADQPIGWDPDLDDGVRLNIRPFVEAGVLRSKVNVHWRKDRGKNPDGSERHNDLHYTNDQKRRARQEAGTR
jgi:hypothetical protein